MSGTRRVLAGDIGGTKTLLRIAEFGPAGMACEVLAEAHYDSAAWPDLTPMVLDFLARQDGATLHAACFGVAGPVLEQSGVQYASLTNLPWRLASDRLAMELGLPRVRLINDFQAVGYGIEGLGPDDFVTLQPGAARPGGPRLAIGAGTGLGVAFLLPAGDHYEVFPTEGGHMDFGPTDPDQDALLAWLRERHGRVSWERVVSGPGIADIYRFLAERDGATGDPLLDAWDVAAAVAGAAGPRAERAMALFLEAYGAAAGNLALAILASGGVYIAGGIAARNLARLRASGFIKAFNEKGRMAPLTRGMPVHVITDPKVGLLGAALAARRL